jgi:hypothetical protein
MSYKIFPTSTFNIDYTTNLGLGEKLYFKFQLVNSTTNDFTASLANQGNLTVSSLSTATGYSKTLCPYLDTASILATSTNNKIVFNSGISSYYDKGEGGYIFVPNPLTGTISPLYDTYGDVDYPFIIKPYDIILIYLSDGTYIESKIIQVIKDVGTNNGNLTLVLDTTLSEFIIEDLTNTGSPAHQFLRILILSRIDDETNTYIVYSKRPGQTSYGFIIPQNISPDILANIDVITKEVKQKLITDQSVIDSINGGGF